jgi:predicted permease
MVLLLMSLLGPFTAAWTSTAVLMAALPPALNVFILAQQYDSWVVQASGSVLFGTLMSVVTLTTVLWMVQTQSLPVQVIH